MKPTTRTVGQIVLSCFLRSNIPLLPAAFGVLAVSLFFAGCSAVPASSGTETATETQALGETEPAATAVEPKTQEQESPTETASMSLPLSSPPQLTLTDSLSSRYDPFTLDSGSYEWSILEQTEIRSVIACGASALDLSLEAEALTVMEYQRLDSIPYLVSYDVPPDRISLREWDAADLGNAEAEPLLETESEDVSLIHLQPGRVYELTAIWEEGKKEERSFFGKASYCFLTKPNAPQ